MRRTLMLTLLLTAVPASAQAFVKETVMVPMRDGTHLATDAFYPSRGGAAPTLLIRTPYGKNIVPDEAAKIVCDDLKFSLVVQDTRGRYDSEGVDDVFMSDGWGANQDGYDTIDWIISNKWSDGQVGIIGASALGITAYMAIGALHPALKTAHIGITPWVFYNTVYPGGTYREALVNDWLEWQGSEHMLDLYKQHPMYDSLWASLDMRTRAAQISIPILHWGGWHDIFTEGPVAGFEALENGGPQGLAGYQRLVMGPWTHMDGGAFSTRQGELTYPDNSYFPLEGANPVEWFEEFLKGKMHRPPRDPQNYPVRYYVMGDPDQNDNQSNRWEVASSWPLPADNRLLYLQPGEKADWAAPVDQNEPESYVYDPGDTSPTIGGHELSLPAGPRDQRPLLERSDYVMFQTEPLTRPFKTVGDIHAVLFGSSDGYDTDFVVRLSDVYPDGRVMLVTTGVLKARYRYSLTEPQFLTPGEVQQFDIDLNTTAQVFGKGHRIQVLVTSSDDRAFQPSPNTEDDVWGTMAPEVATNSIYVDNLRPSHLVFPEPRAGASRPVADVKPPTPALIARAKVRAERGLKLSDAEQRALVFEGGKVLMKMAYPEEQER